MEEKEALDYLVHILKTYSLTEPEKEAVKHAIGILSWTTLKNGAIRAIKEKRSSLTK